MFLTTSKCIELSDNILRNIDNTTPFRVNLESVITRHDEILCCFKKKIDRAVTINEAPYSGNSAVLIHDYFRLVLKFLLNIQFLNLLCHRFCGHQILR